MFETIEIGDDAPILEEKLRRNTSALVDIKAEYDDVQYWLNRAIAEVYAAKLEEAKKKPDTQGIK
jgi:hypothetical protein